MLDNQNSTQDAAQLSPTIPQRVTWQPSYKPSTESPPVVPGLTYQKQDAELVDITPPCRQHQQDQQVLPVVSKKKI
jgi:hypothetical protein